MKKMLMGIVIVACLTGCGKPGKDGSSGVNGIGGLNGIDGSSCSAHAVLANPAAPNGATLVECTNGTSNLVLNGINGVKGVDGHSVSFDPIQFCPAAPHYPSTFPEVGFCIDDQLYGVYSANGGFMAVIQPGAWQSQGIGSSCSFVVEAHCKVHH